MAKKVVVVTQKEVVNTTGGAITSFINISKFLSEQYEVYGICYSEDAGEPDLGSKVKFVNLYNYYSDENTFSGAINHFIEDNKPDIILFFFASLYVKAELSEKYNDIPRILLFRSRPDFYFEVSKKNRRLKKRYVNTVSQILFPSYYNLLPDYIKKNRVVCIPNPTQLALDYVNPGIEHKKIIYLSRLDCWKGHEFLIKSFALIADKYKDWSIDIYGQSQPPELETELKELVKSLNLENQINFCGVTKEPFKTYLNYDFCVFPSYFEGFPNGLSEALSVGLPAIGFKGASGVNELIIDNENGFLIQDDYKLFAQKIEVLIRDKKLRSEFSANAIKSMKKYDYSQIKDAWINLISDILNNNLSDTETNFGSCPCNYELFSIDKLLYIRNKNKKFEYNNFAERILSFKNYYTSSGKKKIITIFGIRLSINMKK